MSEGDERTRGATREAVEQEGFAAMKERMMSHCAKMMPHMAEMCGGAQEDQGEIGANAASPCSSSSDAT